MFLTNDFIFCYPVKLYINIFPDNDSLCSFSGVEDESMSHFWGCTLFLKDFCILYMLILLCYTKMLYLIITTLLKKLGPIFLINCLFFSAFKRLIAINRIQNKSFCLLNICVLCIFIMHI